MGTRKESSIYEFENGLNVEDGCTTIRKDGSNNLEFYDSVTGTKTLADVSAADVVGPGSSTNNTVVRWDGAAGTVIQGSNVTIDDSGNMGVPGGVSSCGSVYGYSGVSSGGYMCAPYDICSSSGCICAYCNVYASCGCVCAYCGFYCSGYGGGTNSFLTGDGRTAYFCGGIFYYAC